MDTWQSYGYWDTSGSGLVPLAAPLNGTGLAWTGSFPLSGTQMLCLGLWQPSWAQRQKPSVLIGSCLLHERLMNSYSNRCVLGSIMSRSKYKQVTFEKCYNTIYSFWKSNCTLDKTSSLPLFALKIENSVGRVATSISFTAVFLTLNTEFRLKKLRNVCWMTGFIPLI